MTYPELVQDYLAIQYFENPKKLQSVLSQEVTVFDTQGMEQTNVTDEELEKFAQEVNTPELKALDDMLDSL